MNAKVRPNDVLASITNPKQSVVNKAQIVTSVRYNSDGKNDLKSKRKFLDSESCAVEITAGKQKIYKVKSKRGGQFFNPVKSGLTYGLEVQDRTSNRPMFEFREVNKLAFDNYVAFLAKRHDSLLLAAEREG